MRVPVWLLTLIVASFFGALGWAVTDRVSIGERLGQYMGTLQQINERLGQIEDKVDRLLLEDKDVGTGQREKTADSRAGSSR